MVRITPKVPIWSRLRGWGEKVGNVQHSRDGTHSPCAVSSAHRLIDITIRRIIVCDRHLAGAQVCASPASRKRPLLDALRPARTHTQPPNGPDSLPCPFCPAGSDVSSGVEECADGEKCSKTLT